MTSSHRPDDAARPAGPARPVVLLLLAVMVLVAIAAFSSRATTAPAGADAPDGSFSAERATAALEPIAQRPRPIGTPANDAARERLATELEQLGFTATTQEVIGSRSSDATVRIGYNRNLIATRPGTDPTGSLVLATHIDSVPMAPGASDAGIGIATILETVRALGPEALRNDLVVLLVDGEEDGLLGAEAFVGDGAEDLTEPIVVLNHEARGIEGRPVITRTNGPMHPLLDAMPQPEAESYIDALFGIIPNDTDFTVYREAGWWGMDMAIIDGSWAYHSPQDDLEHLDASTLQHYGDLTLALTREIGDRDLAELPAEAGATPVMTTTVAGILKLPPLVITLGGLLAPVAVLAAIVVQRGRGALRIPGTLAAAAGGLIAIMASIAAGIGLWEGARSFAPQMLSITVGEPVHARLFFVAEIAGALAVMAAVWALLRRWLSPAATTLGLALVPTAGVAALAVMAPDLGAWLVLPVAAAALGGLLATLLPGPWAVALRVLAIAPTGWMIGQQTSGLMEFGIASASAGLAGTLAIGLLAATALLAPGRSTATASRARPARTVHLAIPAALAAVAVAASGIGIAVSLGSDEPVQARALAHVAADGTTSWEAEGGTAWAQDLDGTAADSDLSGPVAQVVTSEAGQLELEITSPRAATRMDITMSDAEGSDGATLSDITGATLSDITLDGVPLDGEQVSTISLVGVRPGQTVRLQARLSGRPQTLAVTDSTFEPAEAGGYPEPPADVSVVRSIVHVRTVVELAP